MPNLGVFAEELHRLDKQVVKIEDVETDQFAAVLAGDGDYAMVQGHASISKDSPPFSTAMLLNRIAGLNVIGLRRAGFDRNQRAQLRDLSVASRVPWWPVR